MIARRGALIGSGGALTTTRVAASQPAIVPSVPSAMDSRYNFDLGGAIVGGITGFITGGPGGAVVGAAAGGGLIGGGSEPPTNQPAVPGGGFTGPTTSTAGPCKGIFSVRGPDGTCIDLTALPPGGDPAVTGQVTPVAAESSDGYGAAVKGYFGVGIMPRVDVQTVRHCPPGTALGKDGVCYKGLGRNSPKRMWPMGEKPLMTGGDRAAIRRAKSVATKLLGARKSLKKAGKALEKVGC